MTDAVGALRFPVKYNNFPSTVNLVRSFSSFSGFTSHTILPYVIFLSLGTWFLRMKMTAFVPFTPLIPWTNCPSSFSKDIYQNFLSGHLIICLYSWDTPEIWWVTALDSCFFWNFSVNAKSGLGVLLHLDINLELGPSVSTLGGCAFCTLGGGIRTSGGIMLVPEGEM